jgi:hypothetical protein
MASTGMPPAPNNAVSTLNSTTATLGISGNFTGTGEDISRYSSITIQIDSSHDSATDGMTFEFSSDNTNWDDVYLWTYLAADGARRFQFPVTAQYFRVNYTNGGTGQTHFRVQTIFHRNNVLTSIHRMKDNVGNDRSAQIVKAAVVAQINGSGDFTPVASSPAGALDVSVESVAGTAVDTDAGNASAGTQRVVLASDQPVISVDDNAGNLSVDWAGTVPPIGAGTEAAALRVTVATDSTGLLSVDDNGGNLSIDLAGTVPSLNTGVRDAGTQRVTIATDDVVPASQSGTWNINNVSGTVSLPTGAATAANQLADGHNVTVDNAAGGAAVNIQDGGNDISVDWAGTAPPIGAGTEAAALRVTVATDSTGLLSVDDNGTPLRVQGHTQVGAVATGNPLLLGAVVDAPADVAPVGRQTTDGDIGNLAQNGDGSLYTLPYSPQIWSYHEDSSSALTDATVHDEPGTGLSLYVTNVICSTGSATAFNIFFEEGASKVLGPYYLEAVNGRGLALNFTTPKKITAGTTLTVTTSAAIAHSIDVTGYIAPD